MALIACNEEEKYFIPNIKDLPSIVTLSPQEVTTRSAVVGGTIPGVGYSNFLRTGIYIYISSPPDQEVSVIYGNTKKIYSDLICDGKFHIYLSDLQSGTSYYYLAFSEYENRFYYGDLKALVTSYSTIRDIEGSNYQTVKIGSQIWMRENLRTKTFADGTIIDGMFESSFNFTKSIHYNWQAANGSGSGLFPGKNVCPAGWHVPGDNEWQKLLTYTGIPPSQLSDFGLIGDNQASMLKEAGSDSWRKEDNSNLTGFSVMPAETYTRKGEDTGLSAAFWTSSPFIYYGFQRGTGKIIREKDTDGSIYLSVRCIKD